VTDGIQYEEEIGKGISVMKTVVGSFYTITACLVKMLREIGVSSWKTINPTQERFLKIFEVCKRDVDQIREIEYEIGIGTVGPVNAFLRRKSIDIQLNVIGPREIAVASVLDVLVEWMLEGQSTTILKESQEYPAVSLKEGVRVSMVHNFLNPVATITSRTEDKILMTILPEQPKSTFEVFELACTLVENQKSAKAAWGFNGVKFPMINLAVQPNIGWLIGMRSKEWSVSQALQQTKLKMNEKGAHVKEAVAITAKASFYIKEQQPLIIDKPFLLVFQRPSLKRPLFSAFLAEDCWKNPRSLEMY
jgi:hypothetical protein